MRAWLPSAVIILAGGCFPRTTEVLCGSLENGGAEAGDLSGWEGEAEAVQASDGHEPVEGSWFFLLGETGWLEQRCAPVPDALLCGLGGWMIGEGLARLGFGDADGAVLAEAEAMSVGSQAWEAFSLGLDIPEGAWELAVELEGTSEAGFDDLHIRCDVVSGASPSLH
jgi:hypothetical protein